MMQQPSAPKAVAMVRRGWNCSTAQRRICCGALPARASLATAICSSANVGLAISPAGEDRLDIEVFPGLLVAAPLAGRHGDELALLLVRERDLDLAGGSRLVLGLALDRRTGFGAGAKQAKVDVPGVTLDGKDILVG